jgi:hypothetical protein
VWLYYLLPWWKRMPKNSWITGRRTIPLTLWGHFAGFSRPDSKLLPSSQDKHRWRCNYLPSSPRRRIWNSFRRSSRQQSPDDNDHFIWVLLENRPWRCANCSMERLHHLVVYVSIVEIFPFRLGSKQQGQRATWTASYLKSAQFENCSRSSPSKVLQWKGFF